MFIYTHGIRLKLLENMNYTKTVSVIISCRNEEKNILKIISCLKSKKFDKNKLRIDFY